MIPALAVPGTTKGPYAYVSAHKVHILARTKPKKKVQIAHDCQSSRGPSETGPVRPSRPEGSMGKYPLGKREGIGMVNIPVAPQCPRAPGNSHLDIVERWQQATEASA